MTDYGDYTPITVRSKTAQDAPTYTQADLDRIVKAAVDYASQKAAQEARAVALESVIANIRLDVENDDISTGAGQWIIDTILALLDTPAAEALAARDERVRAEERERVHAAIRAGGET